MPQSKKQKTAAQPKTMATESVKSEYELAADLSHPWRTINRRLEIVEPQPMIRKGSSDFNLTKDIDVSYQLMNFMNVL